MRGFDGEAGHGGAGQRLITLAAVAPPVVVERSRSYSSNSGEDSPDYSGESNRARSEYSRGQVAAEAARSPARTPRIEGAVTVPTVVRGWGDVL